MPFAADLPVLILIWGANGYFQSMLWSPILRVFSETIDKTLQKKAVLNISLSLPIGTICSFLVSTVIIKYLKWEYVFIGGGTAAMLCTLLSLLVILYCKRSIKKINRIAADKPEAKTENPAKKNILSIMLMSGLFLIIFPSFLHGMLRDGIANWVPV